ncbi:MAG: hypothetical protein LBL93_04535 [Ruminococcus sp.]|jgi:hypothetical protein|nr:hypothetical protein [Ruminococcus sp.]
MIEINTLIRNTGHKKNNLPEFVSLSEYAATHTSATNIRKIQIKDEYLQGAIVIACYGQEFLGTEYYDCIFPLWQFWLDAIIELKTKPESIVNFPDQPTKIAIRKLYENTLLMKIIGSERNITLPESEFLSAISAAHSEFLKFSS